MYDKGLGVKQNYSRAVTWYHKAAEQGYAKAQDNLSIMYYEGLGVTQDYVKAHILWKLSSVNSIVNSLKNSPKYRSVAENKMKTDSRDMVSSKLADKVEVKKIRTN